VVPLVQPLRASAHVHGESGIGNSKLPTPKSKPREGHAVDYLIERVLAEPNELGIFPIGPLTNIAMAMLVSGPIGTLPWQSARNQNLPKP
jgi:purine nucleosidase